MVPAQGQGRPGISALEPPQELPVEVYLLSPTAFDLVQWGDVTRSVPSSWAAEWKEKDEWLVEA